MTECDITDIPCEGFRQDCQFWGGVKPKLGRCKWNFEDSIHYFYRTNFKVQGTLKDLRGDLFPTEASGGIIVHDVKHYISGEYSPQISNISVYIILRVKNIMDASSMPYFVDPFARLKKKVLSYGREGDCFFFFHYSTFIIVHSATVLSVFRLCQNVLSLFLFASKSG